jgi:hypothetical protein
MKKTLFMLLATILVSNAHQKPINKEFAHKMHVLQKLPFVSDEEEVLQQLYQFSEGYKSDFECLSTNDPKECLRHKIEKNTMN